MSPHEYSDILSVVQIYIFFGFLPYMSDTIFEEKKPTILDGM